jgi:aquaporin Z
LETRKRSVPWLLYGAELTGTALLVAVGLSFVILDFGHGSPVIQLIPSAGWRRLLTGLLFGSTGALIALSPLGKESGAHINPAVTLAFWLTGTLGARHALGYGVAQLAGAILGALPLLAWGGMGQSVAFGATVPGMGYGAGWALVGEAATTFALIVGLFTFVRHRRLRSFTPALFPVLYAAMVYLEAPVSGTSTNPARSLAPAVISGAWNGWWVYWVGPLVGTLLAVAVFRIGGPRWLRIEIAKLYHFGHDRYGVLRPRDDLVVPGDQGGSS